MGFRQSDDLKRSIRRAEEWAEDHKIDASYRRFSHWVYIAFDHNGGSITYANAFLEYDPVDKQFIWVFTEHRGYHVFPKDELTAWRELQPVF